MADFSVPLCSRLAISIQSTSHLSQAMVQYLGICLKMMSQLGILLWKTRLENFYFKNIQQVQDFLSLEYFESYVVNVFGTGFYWDNTWAKSNIFTGQVWWFSWAWISRNCSWQGCSNLVSIFFEWSMKHLRFSLQNM